jgi:hypothetical protein
LHLLKRDAIGSCFSEKIGKKGLIFNFPNKRAYYIMIQGWNQDTNGLFSDEENQLGEKAWGESGARRVRTGAQQAPPKRAGMAS